MSNEEQVGEIWLVQLPNEKRLYQVEILESYSEAVLMKCDQWEQDQYYKRYDIEFVRHLSNRTFSRTELNKDCLAYVGIKQRNKQSLLVSIDFVEEIDGYQLTRIYWNKKPTLEQREYLVKRLENNDGSEEKYCN